jgi:predicted transcriptional regulator
MTVREELHRIVDELPEEKLADVRQFINDLKAGGEGEESLSAETLAAIQEGLEDIRAGRTVSWEQVKRENGL